MTAKARRGTPTKKYLNRRNAIVDAASAILNRKGLKGMTLADVGEAVGMVATGIAYYFPSKEELSAACFQRALDIFEGLIADAAKADTVDARIATLISGYFALRKKIAEGSHPAFAQFDDVRALGDQRILDGYVHMFRSTRQLFEPLLRADEKRAALNPRVHLLVHQFLWMEAWIPKYDSDDYPRVAERVVDILVNGLGSAITVWHSEPLTVDAAEDPESDEARQAFLRAAIDLINEFGYLGASVEKISARLDVTKGSFYHHIDAKDDLVGICFAHTTDAVRRTQKAAARLPVSSYTKLASAVISLVQHQLAGDMPLLRAATVSLPETIRRDVLRDYDRNTLRFGAMLSDGMIDGSIRNLDVHIAAHMLTSVANAIGELPFWLPDPAASGAAESFVRPFFEGLTSPSFVEDR
ncbi:MAG TPA: TetR/AcrR family transcriptional regulator [Rhizomicrobium sp.]|jgi:AcrR family transcriptional regulator|nr:TetR/AcrR family transcriptional regulator [Rhizomicrobium sp.]